MRCCWTQSGPRAKGYLLKNTRVERLLSFLRAMAEGAPALEPQTTARLLDALAKPRKAEPDAAALAQLSDRERAVLEALAAGKTNAEIGQTLFISENTVKIHVRRILAKLGLENRRDAARYKRSDSR